MTAVSRLMILMLMPVMAWQALPHLACRCSNGEVHLLCPKMTSRATSAKSTDSRCTSQGEPRKSCCNEKSSSNCCCSTKAETANAGEPATSCSSRNCHCTPVYLDASNVTKTRIDCQTVVGQFEFVLTTTPVAHRLVLAPTQPRAIDSGQPLAANRIVLFERFLI